MRDLLLASLLTLVGVETNGHNNNSNVGIHSTNRFYTFTGY
jgi:hypothetical protein